MWLDSFSVPSSSSFVEVMMSEDFQGLLFYSDKLYVALNAITSGGSLWIQQKDLEGVLEHYVYLDGMPQAFWLSLDSIHTSMGCFRPLGILEYSLYFDGVPLCLWTFILDSSNGLVMLGPRVMGPIMLVSRVCAYVVGLIFYVLGLPKSQAQCCSLSFECHVPTIAPMITCLSFARDEIMVRIFMLYFKIYGLTWIGALLLAH